MSWAVADRNAPAPELPTFYFLLEVRPPSVNNLYANRKGGIGRVKSEAYREWEYAMGLLLNVQVARFRKEHDHVLPYQGKVQVAYSIGRGGVKVATRRQDLGNREKALSDLLTTCGVMRDDCLIEAVTLRWVDGEGVQGFVAPWKEEAPGG